MPQTRFVLQKALQQNLSLVVAINKIDVPTPASRKSSTKSLPADGSGATDEQLDSPIVYCSGRAGTASMSPNVEGKD